MASLKDKLSTRLSRIADYEDILIIENVCFKYPWSYKELEKTVKDTDTICMVGEIEGEILCYIIYRNHEKFVEILNLAVHPSKQKRGLGTKLINILKKKLSAERRSFVQVMVQERNLVAQVFFRSCGFRACSIRRNQYEEMDDDGYIFRYRCKQEKKNVDTQERSED